MDGTHNIINGPAVVIGCAALLLCLSVQGSTVTMVMTVFKGKVRAMVSEKRNLAAHVFFFAAILVMLMSHLLQIYIWSLFLYFPGIMQDIHKAVLLAGSTYTTVGFDSDTLPLRWQLLEVTMAVTGLFAFAWSTSIMYALSQQLYRAED
ncbi:hypothetical protein DK847_07230 [Aestuariivirga litoralis]|uniref:Potassium channel domain-containing protein n=1 Tax=Aestuariivirga litoralis TaxID=2650924 RepID=A0A2W2BMN4_9HYPH|nr:hypothetical protein [Aestuariivirga litoralis]PZF77117.1 hypothetical protein DK847_07230 [Aestuariivirga litoralis]